MLTVQPSKTRHSVKSTMPGNVRIMTYDDVVEAEQKRAAKLGRGRPKISKPGERKRLSADELEIGKVKLKRSD